MSKMVPVESRKLGRGDTDRLRQGVRHLRAGADPRRAILLERPPDDAAERFRQRRRRLLQGRWLLVDDLVGDGGNRVGQEGMVTRQGLVEDDAEGEEVAAPIELLAPHLLRRHVGRRAEDLAGDGLGRPAELGDAEVHHLGLAVVANEDVGRLDVAVDHPLLMGVVEGEGHLGAVGGGGLDVEPALAIQDGLERLAVDPLHGDEGQAVGGVAIGVENRHDAGMMEAPGGAGFDQESFVEVFLELGIEIRRREEHLDRHLAADVGILGQINPSHRAAAKLGQDLVAPDPGDRLWHRR